MAGKKFENFHKFAKFYLNFLLTIFSGNGASSSGSQIDRVLEEIGNINHPVSADTINFLIDFMNKKQKKFKLAPLSNDPKDYNSYKHTTITRDDIQILFGKDNNHFIFVYFNSAYEDVLIFNSLGNIKLTSTQWSIINTLYPRRHAVGLQPAKTMAPGSDGSTGLFAVAYALQVIDKTMHPAMCPIKVDNLGTDPAAFIRNHIKNLLQAKKCKLTKCPTE